MSEQENGSETEPKIAYWDCSNNTEHLSHTDEDEAIEDILDMRQPEDWPDRLTVYAFARVRVDPPKPERVLEHVLEWLDEEHGDPDGQSSSETAKMRDAAKAFCDAIAAEYVPWACEQLHGAEVEINVADWVREHRPEWIKDEPKVAAFVAKHESRQEPHP